MLRDGNAMPSSIDSALTERSALGTGKSAVNKIAFMELIVRAQQDIVGWRLSDGDRMAASDRDT